MQGSISEIPCVVEDLTAKDKNLKLPELKRVQSVKEKVKSYQRQKLAIKEALCNLDRKPKNKIIFDDNSPFIYNESIHQVALSENTNKKDLFDSDVEEEEEDTCNLDLKKQFDGEQGQQLFELQSRFKGDERFKLNERFLDNYENDSEDIAKAKKQSSIEEEKKNEIDILEQVLGTKIKPHISETKKHCVQEKMLRYDPTHFEHKQYEVVPKKQTKTSVHDRQQKNYSNESEPQHQPVVSKDVFYKVHSDFKNTFEEPEKFSLLNLFGKVETNEDKDQSDPGDFDPSDDEALAEPVPGQDVPAEVSTCKFTSEALFFKADDYRLQEGYDFVQRMASEKNKEFEQERHNLKCIIRAKVRNNNKKNNPFKKRLGGNKKKKILKIKKALKK